MILLKTLGAALILSVGGIAAFSAVRYEKKRLGVIDGWIDLILYIRAQIDCYLTPIDEILKKEDRPTPNDVNAPDAPADLSAVLNASRVYLDGDAKRLLERFVGEIGSSYREDQLKRCDYCVGSLRTQRERIAAALPSRTRLCAALCLCASIGTAILLW